MFCFFMTCGYDLLRCWDSWKCFCGHCPSGEKATAEAGEPSAQHAEIMDMPRADDKLARQVTRAGRAFWHVLMHRQRFGITGSAFVVTSMNWIAHVPFAPIAIHCFHLYTDFNVSKFTVHLFFTVSPLEACSKSKKLLYSQCRTNSMWLQP